MVHVIPLDDERSLVFTDRQLKKARAHFSDALRRTRGGLLLSEAEFYAAKFPKRITRERPEQKAAGLPPPSPV